ncbi:MAG: TerD family protein [Clostridia bacterium]|nr:TerD family protein [Clostridia bacterium]
MSVNLVKGQKINLRKEGGDSLTNVMVGLGWDEVEQKRGFFSSLFSAPPADIDCDASAILCQNGKLVDKKDLVFYNNLRHYTGTVVHQGDNLTGAGEGDDEQIFVNLDALPQIYDRIVFVVTIYQAYERKQHFGLIRNAFIRVCDGRNGRELCKFNLSENYYGKTAMVVGELYRSQGEWKFNAIGQPTNDNSIIDMAARFQ